MIWLLIAIGCFFTDIIMKERMDKKFSLQDEAELFNGRIKLRKAYNKGAALNILQEKPQVVKGLTTAISGSLLVIYLGLLFQKGCTLLKFSFSLMIGGAFSNLTDRIRKGHVVDYFSFRSKLQKLSKLVFNLGDLFIFIGGIGICIWELFRSRK